MDSNAAPPRFPLQVRTVRYQQQVVELEVSPNSNDHGAIFQFGCWNIVDGEIAEALLFSDGTIFMMEDGGPSNSNPGTIGAAAVLVDGGLRVRWPDREVATRWLTLFFGCLSRLQRLPVDVPIASVLRTLQGPPLRPVRQADNELTMPE